MRAVARAAVALVVALAIAAALAAWLVPRWLAGEDARARLLAAARDATGRDVDAGGLGFALFPPRLVAQDVRVGDAAAPLVTAESVDLRLDAGQLLSRTLVVESLALEGVTWRVARTRDGIELPWKGDAPKAAIEASPAATAAAGAASGLRLAVARITLERSLLVWDDAAREPPVRIEVRDVTGEARGAGPDAPLALTLTGALASGGTLRIERDPSRPDAPDLELTLDGVDLAALAPYLGKDLALAGRVAGTLRARGAARSLEALDASLEVSEASVRAGDVDAKGPVGIQASLSGAIESLTGSFELDATRAELSAYGGAFRKPPGAPAKATGRLVRDASGRLGVDGVRVKIENMDGNASLALEGTFFADATRLRSEDLVLRVGGQPVAIALAAEALDTAPRHRTRAVARGVDARALLAALGGGSAVLEGPLSLDADLAGPLGAQAAEALAGAISLAVGPGRIPDLSPLGATIDLLDRYPEVGRALNRKKTERRLAPFLGDRFESIDGRFAVADGRARTDALVLRYPGYRLELRGSVGLADRALDAKGRLVLDPALEAALAGEDAGGASGGPVRVIEIARVGGTVERPKLQIDQAGAIAFAASLTLAQKRDKWERKIDKALGNGKGGEILDALDGILGKKERR